jgi:RNA polymerase sigma factor (sigma-70 family)
MDNDTDAALLRSFVTEGDETAFSALVARYVPMVRGVALRCTGEEHLADEVTQTVFTVLTRKAPSIPAAHLPGWLHKSASFAALAARRKCRRYQRALAGLSRQPEAMNTRPETSSWTSIRPHLDEAISSLPEKSRRLVIQRFFEGKSIREIATTSGKSEDASRKQLQRALERLSGILKRQGVVTTGAALSAALGTQILLAPPASAAAVAAAALEAGPSLAASSTILIQTTAFMTTKTIAIAAVAVALTLIPSVILWQKNSALQQEVSDLRAMNSRRPQVPRAIEPARAVSSAVKVQATSEAPATSRDEAAAQMGRALRTNDPILRTRRFIDVLALMTPENGQAYLDGWLKYCSDNRTPADQAQLFNRRVGQVLGKVVTGNRTGTPGDMRGNGGGAVRDQFLGWMDTDPGAAKAWLDGLKNEAFREAMVGPWLEVTARQNPAAAAAWLRTLPEDLQRRYAQQMVKSLRESRPAQEVGDWFTGIASENADTLHAVWLCTAWDTLMWSVTETKGIGPEAIRLFEQHAGQPYADSSWGERIAGKFLASDPPNGLVWTLRMAARPEVSDSDAFLSRAAATVSAEKLPAVIASCQDLSDSPSRDSLLGMLALRLTETDPAAAAAAVARIKDPARRPVLPAAASR